MALTKINSRSGLSVGKPFFMARMSGNQTLTDNAEVLIEFNSEDYDTSTCYNTSTYRFTPDVAGYYYIGARL